MSWEYFILFAIAALVCWALGAFTAWKGTKRDGLMDLLS